MQQRDLGKTGLRVSALGFGTGAIGGLFVRGDPAERRRAVARALEAGITYFDTAPSVSTALVGYSDLKQLEDAIRWTARGPLPEHVVGRILDFARNGTRPGARPSAGS